MLSGMSCRGVDWGVVHLLQAMSRLVVLLGALPLAWAETAFFNSYGHCIRHDPFTLEDGEYRVKAVSAFLPIHESLVCDLTFKAPPSNGICLTFNSFEIIDCGVTLQIYQQSTASGRQWKRLTCEDERPSQMCTPERYVTLKLVKRRLNNNKNYEFDITIEQSSNLTGEDVILASSIGLFAGIIAGVVALIAVVSVIILCCCCKPCKSRAQPPGYSPPPGPAPDIRLHPPPPSGQNPSVQPSAPPASEIGEELTPLQQGPQGPLYPALPQGYSPGSAFPPHDLPPPYAPPPYEDHAYPTKE